MILAGLQKFSMIDYPEKLSAVVFAQGCNFVCPYCHNPKLNEFNAGKNQVDEKHVLDFLKSRINKIDAVVISGGEPTLQEDLIGFAKKIKDLGFLLKLDTNGTQPHVLTKLIENNLLDYISMDIKTTAEKYQHYSKDFFDFNVIKNSVAIIMNSGIDYEFRTTIVKELLSIDEILEIGNIISGAKKYYLQKFVCSSALLSKESNAFSNYSDEEFAFLINQLEKNIKFVFLR